MSEKEQKSNDAIVTDAGQTDGWGREEWGRVVWLTIIVFGFRIVWIDDNHLPIGLTLINHGQDAEDFNFNDLAARTDLEITD